MKPWLLTLCIYWKCARVCWIDPATLAKLDVALKKAMTDPKVLESFQHQGAELLNLDRKQCQQFVDEESDRWSATIKKINLKSE